MDIITPIPKTLIPDDERRKGVNRGFLIAAALIFLFLFIYWLFKDLAEITDASGHPFLLVLLGLAKVLAGVIMYLVACWGCRVCVHVYTLKSGANRSKPPKSIEPQPVMNLSEPDPPAIRDLCEEGTPHQFFSNLYQWIALESNRKGPQLAYLYYALSLNHILKDPKPKKMLNALMNTYPDFTFAKDSAFRHACSNIKNRPEGREKKEDQARIAAIYKELTAPKLPK
ncbi:MAG: hypothetical protein IJV37_06070 [Bacteroidales bacterium]|nr:hypothetical protein [Bacteroidales bacterium]